MNTLLSPLRLHAAHAFRCVLPSESSSLMNQIGLSRYRKTLLSQPWQINAKRGLLTTTLSDPGMLSMLPANIMTALHATGMPWIVTLPATALLIRSTLVYPIVRRRRKNLTKLALLQPLVDARISHRVLSDQWAQSSKFKSSQIFGDKDRATRNIRFARHIEEIRLERYFRIPTARYTSKVVPILILLAVSEGVRRVCGMDRGLLSILFGPFQPYIEKVLTSVRNATQMEVTVGREGETRTELFGHTIEMMYKDFHADTWMQPSMREGGLPWCPDLTQPDATHVLPVVFSATFFASVWFSPKEVKRGSFYSQSESSGTQSGPSGKPADTSSNDKPRRTFWQKFMLGMAVVSLVPAWNMPTALVWYFISNMAVSRLQTRHLNMKFPITVPPLACKTRARMMSATDKLDLRPVLGPSRRP
ncbi:hypothetical protein BDZ85DRAFT_265073 [Elsinoe ampelina]|uniref:60Kd inner membrane protein-domain-containing protein n=1 Tax=Elsinoe ampelina TaxID=302913 RepID=A0A6A6G922_9PEZI|nr:hypothetical protein BDZ85DRAFT_265073 [Elsinoe ampelina]